MRVRGPEIVIMWHRVGRRLVLSALVFLVLCDIATCESLEFELQLADALLEVGDLDRSSAASLQGFSREFLLEGHLADRAPKLRDRRTRPRKDLGQQSWLKKDDARMTASQHGTGNFLQDPELRSSMTDGALTLRGSKNSRALLQQPSNPSCPVDFRFIHEFPSYDAICQSSDPSNSSSTCCTALLSAIGQAESEHLRNSGEFRFKDEATVGACMGSLSSELNTEDNSLSSKIVPTCFPASNYSKFTGKRSNCQGIETRADFERLAGSELIASTLNHYCSSSSLGNIELCRGCVNALYTVIQTLSLAGPNSSDCVFYTLFYAAGISNPLGPYDQGTASCILAVTPYLSKGGNSSNLALHVGIGAAAAFVVSLIAFAIFFLWWKRRKSAARREFVERNTRLLKTAMRPNTGLIEYSFEEIKAATNSFSSSKNYIGSGGFGDVYRGLLDDGLEVAVKRMKNCSPDGDAEFLNEVTVINSVRHRNLVILRGCCVASTEADGHQRLLVYDYIANGSLQDYLFPKKNPKPLLQWPDRKRIAIGMAKGMKYLHNDARPSIIHRDIKAANVLLDEKLNAKVADFGLAKFSIEGQSVVETAVVGTLGYRAPEYAIYGHITDRSDVYSFGVVLLELMSGRSAIEGLGECALITDWAWRKVNEGKLMDVVDVRIRNKGPREAMERFVLVGILCSHMLVAFRPSMEEALSYLEGDLPLPVIPTRPLPISMELSGDDALVLPSPRPPPPRSLELTNIAEALRALSVRDESEEAQRYREQMAAMREYSGNSAGVPTASLIR